MGDYHVMMQFEVAADGAALAKRLRGAGAIASWWSDTIDGAADAVGDHFQVSFPAAPSPFDLEVTSLGDSFVEWYIASQPEP